MVQNFQTLPEIGRAGLKVGTIQKSTKSVQKHGPANEKEAGGGPLLVPSEIVGPQVHFVEACSWREDTHVWWKACDNFLLCTGAQMSPCPLHTAAQPPTLSGEPPQLLTYCRWSYPHRQTTVIPRRASC